MEDGDHGVLELGDADDVKHEIVVEAPKVWYQKCIQGHPENDLVNLFDLQRLLNLSHALF